MKIYLIGALRNPRVPQYANMLRDLGHDVFDDWHAPGPETDEFWQQYVKGRKLTFAQALDSPHAWNVFRFDKLNLDRADAGILIMPAGRSGHIELGYMVGTGKLTYVLFEKEPERYDVMYRFCTGVFTDWTGLATALHGHV